MKPEMREESHILTVRAWVTATAQVLTQPTTETSVSLQTAAEAVSETNVALQEQITESNVALQRVVTKTNYALQRVLSRVRR